MSLKVQVFSYLSFYSKGRDNATTSEALALRFRIPERVVRQVIRELRREGHPIGPGGRGYWYVISPDEHLIVMSKLKSRAFDLLKTVSIQERIPAAELAGQLKISLES
jgi:hypothetical protein